MKPFFFRKRPCDVNVTVTVAKPVSTRFREYGCYSRGPAMDEGNSSYASKRRTRFSCEAKQTHEEREAGFTKKKCGPPIN